MYMIIPNLHVSHQLIFLIGKLWMRIKNSLPFLFQGEGRGGVVRTIAEVNEESTFKSQFRLSEPRFAW